MRKSPRRRERQRLSSAVRFPPTRDARGARSARAKPRQSRPEETKSATARLAAYTPERFDIAAQGIAAELDAATDDDAKNAILVKAEQYAVEVAALEQDVDVVTRWRLNRRRRCLWQRATSRFWTSSARQDYGGSPEQVEASVGQAADIREQRAGNLSASQQADLGVALGRSEDEHGRGHCIRGITTEKAEKIYDAQLNAASAGRLRDRKKEDRQRFALMSRVEALTRKINRIEEQLRLASRTQIRGYRALQRDLTDAVAVRTKLLSEDLAGRIPPSVKRSSCSRTWASCRPCQGSPPISRPWMCFVAARPGVSGFDERRAGAFLIDSVNKGTDIGRVFLRLNSSLGQGVKAKRSCRFRHARTAIDLNLWTSQLSN